MRSQDYRRRSAIEKGFTRDLTDLIERVKPLGHKGWRPLGGANSGLTPDLTRPNNPRIPSQIGQAEATEGRAIRLLNPSRSGQAQRLTPAPDRPNYRPPRQSRAT
jgi:hypothetical protein